MKLRLTSSQYSVTTPGSGGVITFTLPSTFDVTGLLAIIDRNTGATLYTVGTPSLTLQAFTAATITLNASVSVAASDLLTIIYDDGNAYVPTTETYANLAVNAAGASGAPISVSQGATLLAAARVGRKEVTIIFENAIQARIGQSTVSATAYGVLYGGAAQEAITISGGAAVYGYAPTGTAIISVLEVF